MLLHFYQNNYNPHREEHFYGRTHSLAKEWRSQVNSEKHQKEKEI
jgi:hypothetical protein